MNNLAQGKYGEELAEKFLVKKGYKILERNFRIRGGEIDLIAKDGDTLVYVEVKTRSSYFFGYPQEAVGARKIKFIERASKFWRLKRKVGDSLERIDVVSVDLVGQKPRLTLIKNASG